MAVKRILRKVYSRYLGKKWGILPGLQQDLADEFLADYREKKLPLKEIMKIHEKGYSVEGWQYYELDDEKCKTYLPDAEYYGMHPINGPFSKWIDDKLTLKYLCAGTPVAAYMPDYYYHIDEDGRILCLMDSGKQGTTATAEDIAQLLRSKGSLAIKAAEGAVGAGFYKGRFVDDSYYLNQEELDLAQFCSRIRQLRNYLITEFVTSHPAFDRFSAETANSIRYIVGRVDGKMEFLFTGIRFGTKASGSVDNYGAGGIWCRMDANGCFERGEMMDPKDGKNIIIQRHPDTGAELKGVVPHWDRVLQAVDDFCNYFPQLIYLGFDFVVTPDGQIKILEVNSLSGLDGLQYFDISALEGTSGAFFRSVRKKKREREV